MRLGSKLRKARIDKGLSIKELAEATGVSMVSISNFERERRAPHSNTLVKLNKVLQLDVDELYDLLVEEEQRQKKGN